jgi:hypothetical protein
LMLAVSQTNGVRADPIAMDVEVEIIAQSQTMWNGQPLPPFSHGQPEISILKYTIPPARNSRTTFTITPMLDSYSVGL